jgi:hypothetical protein
VLRHVYHSCRNRHCPQCQTRAKEAWLAARRRELLPVPYFHLVFTLPHALNGLAGGDSRTLYALLFGAVADTLDEFAANTRWLGGTPSFTLVLHTWKQDLGRHIHVHALVAGGALTKALGNGYRASWTSGPAYYDGRTRYAVTGAGDLVSTVAGWSQQAWDMGRTRVAAAALNRYILAGYWDNPGSPTDWIRDNVLPVVPCSLVQGPQGIYPLHYCPDVRPDDVKRAFTMGPMFRRLSRPSQDGSLVNHARLEYAPGLGDPQYTALRIAGKGEDTVSLRSHRSWLRHQRGYLDDGFRRRQETSNLVFSGGRSVVRDWAALLSHLPLVAEYAAMAPRDWRHPLGEILAITDAPLGWSRMRCMVVGKELSGARCIYRVMPLPVAGDA